MELVIGYCIGVVSIIVYKVWQIVTGRWKLTQEMKDNPSWVVMDILSLAALFPLIFTAAGLYHLFDKLGKMLVSSQEG